MKLLLNIKKERDDLGKQVNNSTNKLPLKTFFKFSIAILLIAVGYSNIQAQDLSFNSSRKYKVGAFQLKEILALVNKLL